MSIRPSSSSRLQPGDLAPRLDAVTIHGRPVQVPDPAGRFTHTHLQFRRFAGCPVCNFHLIKLAKRHAEVSGAGIRQVVFFHSGAEEMLAYQGRLPFDCVADPQKRHYRAWGVEVSLLALLHPRVLWSGTRGVLATRRLYKRAENGVLGLPADFLVDARGRVVAAKYGEHADDQWGADELLSHALESVAHAHGDEADARAASDAAACLGGPAPGSRLG